MLEYENQMFLEALQDDGLMIVAKYERRTSNDYYIITIKYTIIYRGLGLETVFANILKVYLDPGNLVLVLGTTDRDEEYFIDKLKSMGVATLPKIITAQITSNERSASKIYFG